MSEPLDLLAIVAHPDDAELGSGGTLARFAAEGKRVGVVDLTRGELGTRGTPEQRHEEAQTAAGILKLTTRLNLGLPDGFFENRHDAQRAVIRAVRLLRPRVIITNALEDRHPDHGRAARLVRHASWLAGLQKIATEWENRPQHAHRPQSLLYMVQDRFLQPDLVVDISAHWATKMNAVQAFKSQFYDPNNTEPETYIASPQFMTYLEGRAIEMGHFIGVQYGEGFLRDTPMPLRDLDQLC